MRAFNEAEAARRHRIIEEADQRAENATSETSKMLDGFLARLLGKDSAEDQIQFGDLRAAEEEEDE